MLSLEDIPPWLGTGIFGALTLTIGYFWKELRGWWRKKHESRRDRRLRLEQLDRLLNESWNLFLSQRTQAQRLFEHIQKSNLSAISPGLSLNQVFSRAFRNFSKEDQQLHAIIRGVTETALRRVNQEMTRWLQQDDWFKQSKGDLAELDELATALRQLELHLNEWHANFSAVFEKEQSFALNYLGDEQHQGTKFPPDMKRLVKRALANSL